MNKPRLLIIDDERHTRDGLQRALKNRYEVVTTDNAERALDLILERGFEIVLTDLKLPGLDGVNFIRRVKTMERPPICLLFTAYGSIQNAVEAMKAGADDYLTKPVDLDDLELKLKSNLEKRQLREENRELKRELASKYALERIVGQSAAMAQVFDTIKQIAPARSTVLLTGESGTGKELAARAIHQLSPRADRAFVPVHCAALPENLLQSELFGHEKGAFTGATERRVGRFEGADGGTILLDEIGEIAPAVQVMLLRFLETRAFERVGGNTPISVDLRLIAATNRDLREAVAAGHFREDLFFRLNVIEIRMPSLRERRDDVPLLLKYYLDLFNRENAKQIQGFTPEALKALTGYSWPGNVRELRNCVERLVVLARSESITLKDIPEEIREDGRRQEAAASGATLDLEQNERQLIVKALHDCGGNRSAAAEKLGISRRTLHRRLHEFGLTSE